jgi:CD2 antigen cytoplasmic tail-binding protein 2
MASSSKRPFDGGDESSKKARFDVRNPSRLAADEPEDEDAVLELDEIGKGGIQAKRKAVKIDGYESDSSTENFDARANKKATTDARADGPADDDEDNDMFADLEEDLKDEDEGEDLNHGGKKKNAVRFLDTEDIEGQVLNSKSGGHVSADFRVGSKKRDNDDESSSESGGDEERDRMDDDMDEELGAGAKKKHAPKLDAFNMKQEGEEGRFDESGNFVRKAADPDAVHDSWMEGLSKKDLKRAREAHQKRQEDQRKQNMANESTLTSDILKSLILRLERGETVLEALARLGKSKQKKKPKWQKNKKKQSDSMDVDPEQTSQEETLRKEAVETITGAADLLLGRGETEIYDSERELLVRQWQRETGETWEEPAAEEVAVEETDPVKRWEYRWSDARDGGERHGPYDGPTMKAWNDAGYFGDGVEFREADSSGEWSRSVSFG